MWEIWKGRCATLYGGKKQTAVSVLIAAVMGAKLIQQQKGVYRELDPGTETVGESGQHSAHHECWVDGSFSLLGHGGVGYWLGNEERMV